MRLIDDNKMNITRFEPLWAYSTHEVRLEGADSPLVFGRQWPKQAAHAHSCRGAETTYFEGKLTTYHANDISSSSGFLGSACIFVFLSHVGSTCSWSARVYSEAAKQRRKRKREWRHYRCRVGEFVGILLVENSARTTPPKENLQKNIEVKAAAYSTL